MCVKATSPKQLPLYGLHNFIQNEIGRHCGRFTKVIRMQPYNSHYNPPWITLISVKIAYVFRKFVFPKKCSQNTLESVELLIVKRNYKNCKPLFNEFTLISVNLDESKAMKFDNLNEIDKISIPYSYYLTRTIGIGICKE
jgi:hypothetical protein